MSIRAGLARVQPRSVNLGAGVRLCRQTLCNPARSNAIRPSLPATAIGSLRVADTQRRFLNGLPKHAEVGNKRFADFDLAGRTFVVTGGARGLGLALAESLVEAGGKGNLSTMLFGTHIY